jgi:hypothetical protein
MPWWCGLGREGLEVKGGGAADFEGSHGWLSERVLKLRNSTHTHH